MTRETGCFRDGSFKSRPSIRGLAWSGEVAPVAAGRKARLTQSDDAKDLQLFQLFNERGDLPASLVAIYLKALAERRHQIIQF